VDFNAVGRASFGAGHEARDDDWRDAAAEPEMEGNGRFRTCLARIWLICGVLFPAGSLGAFPHADPRSIDPDVPMRPVLAVGVTASVSHGTAGSGRQPLISLANGSEMRHAARSSTRRPSGPRHR
jgi:hypothetical protein